MRNNTLLCQKAREGKKMKKIFKKRRTENGRQELANKRKQKQQPSASFQLDDFPSTSTHWDSSEYVEEQQQHENQEEEIEEVENQEESRFYDNLASRIIPIEKKIEKQNIATQTSPVSSSTFVEKNCIDVCPFCSSRKLTPNNIRHFLTKKCKFSSFYNNNSKWSKIFENIHNITIDTTNFVKNLKKRRGKSLVYLVRNGVEIKNLIYVGATKDVEKRFSREHKWNKKFDGFDKLEKAVLIEMIETDKSHLLESLLILSDNNSNLVNRHQEYNNFLSFIEYRPSGVEEQVAHLHTLAVKFLLEQWNLITWVPFERSA
uniref:GIY-YIG domain-containing protein n=3 Tax=Meloidogyne TaxID=189290 RepID=A0A6V7VC18_MELEN|nr:unnamed protein product [Meloidogyne enterolobii]